MCEALWQPDMSPEEIFECIAQALTNALDRDASSGKYKKYSNLQKIFNLFLLFFSILGWGAVVHIIEVDKITTKKIKTRMD
jgi:20S proteasome subunit beta 3